MQPPLIGITTSTRIDPQSGNHYSAAYLPNIKAIERAGGLPILIPSQVSDDILRMLYERVDAVLLPGGGDIDSKYYGEVLHPKAANFDADRDRAELQIARWSVEDDRPLFSICRGHQVFNVAMGGSLIQDIPSQLETELTHDQDGKLPRSGRVHPVQINPNSRLASILGTTQLDVNSLHHQSVKTAAPSVHVTATAPDGVVEAIELADRRFAISVQWHPEDLVDGDEAMANLFREFVNAAASR